MDDDSDALGHGGVDMKGYEIESRWRGTKEWHRHYCTRTFEFRELAEKRIEEWRRYGTLNPNREYRVVAHRDLT